MQLSIAVRFGGLALGVVLTVAGFFLPAPNQRMRLRLSLLLFHSDAPSLSVRWASWMRRISQWPQASVHCTILTKNAQVPLRMLSRLYWPTSSVLGRSGARRPTWFLMAPFVLRSPRSFALLINSTQGYGDIAYQGCTITGSTIGQATVSGADYVRIRHASRFLPPTSLTALDSRFASNTSTFQEIFGGTSAFCGRCT